VVPHPLLMKAPSMMPVAFFAFVRSQSLSAGTAAVANNFGYMHYSCRRTAIMRPSRDRSGLPRAASRSRLLGLNDPIGGHINPEFMLFPIRVHVPDPTEPCAPRLFHIDLGDHPCLGRHGGWMHAVAWSAVRAVVDRAACVVAIRPPYEEPQGGERSYKECLTASKLFFMATLPS
jgi:hypothetical protein